VRAPTTHIAVLLAALVAAGCSGAAGDGSQAGAAADGSQFRPVANVGQLMAAIVIPESDRVFESVVYENGVLTAAPETLEDWAALEFSAIALAESGNLMLMPPRARDNGEWVARVHEFIEASQALLRTARTQDVDAFLLAGSDLYDTCLSCHTQYIPPDVP
jgi:hypothetical protein